MADCVTGSSIHLHGVLCSTNAGQVPREHAVFSRAVLACRFVKVFGNSLARGGQGSALLLLLPARRSDADPLQYLAHFDRPPQPVTRDNETSVTQRQPARLATEETARVGLAAPWSAVHTGIARLPPLEPATENI